MKLTENNNCHCCNLPKPLVHLIGIITILAVGIFIGLTISKSKSSPISQTPQISPTPTSTEISLISPKPSSEGGWQTYKNNKYKLEFKYPSKFIPKESAYGILLETVVQGEMIDIVVDSYDQILKDIKEYSSEEEARRASMSYLVSETDYSFGVNQSISGKKITLRRFLNSGGNYDEEIIYFKNNSHSFAVQSSDIKSRDQILSTFKFTNSATPSEAEGKETLQKLTINYSPKSELETYTDDIAKFSIQYQKAVKQPNSYHQILGSNTKAGGEVTIQSCHTPQDSLGPGKEVCLGQYTLKIYNNYDGGSRRTWLSKNFEYYFNSKCQKYYADILIAGKNALLATSECGYFGETYILVPNGSQMVVFSTEGYSRENSNGKIFLGDFIKNALSTFKFIN